MNIRYPIYEGVYRILTFYPAPEKEEEKPDQPKQKAVSKKKKASK